MCTGEWCFRALCVLPWKKQLWLPPPPHPSFNKLNSGVLIKKMAVTKAYFCGRRKQVHDFVFIRVQHPLREWARFKVAIKIIAGKWNLIKKAATPLLYKSIQVK